MTHDVGSENGVDARKFLQKLRDLGFNVTAAFADYSQIFTEAVKGSILLGARPYIVAA